MGNLTMAELHNLIAANPDIHLDDPDALGALQSRATSTEHALQAAVVAECDRRAISDARWGMLFAIPNGGQRHAAVAAKLRAEGVRAGVPDLFLACPSRGYHGAFVELKVGRNYPSTHQRAWISALSTHGYFVATVWDDPAAVIELIDWYLN